MPDELPALLLSPRTGAGAAAVLRGRVMRAGAVAVAGWRGGFSAGARDGGDPAPAQSAAAAAATPIPPPHLWCAALSVGRPGLS